MARVAAGGLESRVQSEVLSDYFRATGLEQLTNFTRTVGVNTGARFLHRLGQAVSGEATWMSRARGADELAKLGVLPKDQKAFATFVVGLDGRIPTGEELDAAGQAGRLYRAALFRFTDQSVMRPNAAVKPSWASLPSLRILFALQSYGYTFAKNVLRRQGQQVMDALNAKNGLEMRDRIAMLGNVAMLSALVMAQYGLSEIRDLLDETLTGQEKRPMTLGAKVERAISRAGLFGAADPYMQAVSGSRYNKSAAQSALGPILGMPVDMVDSFAQLGFRNSSTTDSSERNAMDVGYRNIAEPFVAFVASRYAPTYAAFVAIQATRYAREGILDEVAPVKKTARNFKPTGSTVETLAGIEEPTRLTPDQRREIAESKRRVRENR
jgi:hypothetical protein